jgi:RNA polymerase sigma-70 factor (ECF subfamily)
VRQFEDIYDEYLWTVHGFFAYRTGSRADAEDLTQVTFERALRAWPRYDPARSKPNTWLLAIAKNVLIDEHRRAQARSHGAPALPLDEIPEQGGAGAPEAPGMDPDVEHALGSLPAREREILALRFGADLDGPAIAEVTGLSLANVQQILSRTLRKLQAALAGSELARSRRDL